MILNIPIKLTGKQTEEYQKLYKEQSGKDISKEEAEEMGLNLIGLIAIVYKNDESWYNLEDTHKGRFKSKKG